jgi:hypothetical protein
MSGAINLPVIARNFVVLSVMWWLLFSIIFLRRLSASLQDIRIRVKGRIL